MPRPLSIPLLLFPLISFLPLYLCDSIVPISLSIQSEGGVLPNGACNISKITVLEEQLKPEDFECFALKNTQTIQFKKALSKPSTLHEVNVEWENNGTESASFTFDYGVMENTMASAQAPSIVKRSTVTVAPTTTVVTTTTPVHTTITVATEITTTSTATPDTTPAAPTTTVAPLKMNVTGILQYVRIVEHHDGKQEKEKSGGHAVTVAVIEALIIIALLIAFIYKVVVEPRRRRIAQAFGDPHASYPTNYASYYDNNAARRGESIDRINTSLPVRLPEDANEENRRRMRNSQEVTLMGFESPYSAPSHPNPEIRLEPIGNGQRNGNVPQPASTVPALVPIDINATTQRTQHPPLDPMSDLGSAWNDPFA